jgi:hypothetical protein
MARQRFGISVLIVMALLAVTATAQKNEIAGSVGRVFISDQGVTSGALTGSNIHFGNALTYEANYAHRFINLGIVSVNVEVPFVFTPSVKLNFAENLVPKNFRSYFVTPAVRANLFPTTAFSPWVSVGGGFGRFAESDQLVFGGTNTGNRGTTSGVFQAGIGLDVKIISSFKLRGEVRDFYSGVPQFNVDTGKDRQHNIYVAGGVVFSF